MKYFLIIGSVLIHFCSPLGWAMTPDPIVADHVSAGFEMNPATAILQDQFNKTKRPLFTVGSDGTLIITDAVVPGKRYDCRIFYAISPSSTMVGPGHSIWYQFTKFGELVLQNLAYNEFNFVQYYAPHYFPLKPEQNNELWGVSTEQTYHEAIRVKKNGDLLIVGFSEKFTWTSHIARIYNLENSAELHVALQGFVNSKILAFPFEAAGQTKDGVILSQTVCPNNPDPLR